MSDASDMIQKLDRQKRDYLNNYFSNAPASLMEQFQTVRIPAGTIFIDEGTSADRVFILLSGKVIAVDYRVREMAYGYCHFQPVEAFGAMEILGNMDRYKTTLATKEDSVFLKITRSRYENWIRNDLNALKIETCRVIDYLLEQARKDRLYMLLSGNKRIYLILINLYETYGKGRTYRVYMSRKDFVETTGLSERTVTRVLKELSDSGRITRNGWNIVMTFEQYIRLKELMDDQIIEMGSEI